MPSKKLGLTQGFSLYCSIFYVLFVAVVLFCFFKGRALYNLGWLRTLYTDKASLILETRDLVLLNERHASLCLALYLIFRDKVTRKI